MRFSSALSALITARAWRLPAQAPVLGVRHYGHAVLLLMASLLGLFALQGAPRPLAQWHWMDVIGEGGMAAMVGVWLAYLRGSRPAGPVTNWLCLGMTVMLLGAYIDMLDEFLLLPKALLWDNWLESVLTPLGMLLLTRGLHLWRQEQLVLRRQLGPRERMFRDHRRIDALTQLADAGYMAGQIELERSAGRVGAVLMLGWQGFETVARRHGLAEADRMLQAAGQLLALHLRPDDLLCRYAGDRFVVLLPGCVGAVAEALARELQQALAGWAYSLDSGERLRLPVALAHAATTRPLGPADLLLKLAAELRHGA